MKFALMLLAGIFSGFAVWAISEAEVAIGASFTAGAVIFGILSILDAIEDTMEGLRNDQSRD